MRVLRFTLCSLLTAAVVASGCGGSSANSSSDQTKFVSRADAICAKATQQGRVLPAPKGAAGTISFLEKARALIERTHRELQTVAPPSSSRAAYDRFLAAIAQEVESMSELIRAVRARDRGRYQAITKRMATNTVNRQATTLGLPACSETVEPHSK
jgi:hypothetical protein